MSTYTTNTNTKPESKFEDVPEEVLTDPTMRTALGMDPIPGMNTPVDDNKQISMFDYMQNKNNSSTSSSTTTTAPEVTVFKNLVHPEFGELRTVEIDGEPWFVGKDVATALGYCNINKAVAAHVDEDDKKVLDFKGFSQNGKSSGLWVGHDFSSKTIINESGLYSLILSSKLPSAKEFKHWVTSEVLPSIRKNGAYIRNQENMTPAEIVAHGLIAAQGKDVATALGYTNSRDAIATHVFADDKGGVESIDTLGGRQKMTIINESGLYALVFGSRLKIATDFKHWVTSKVLPSIRKNGAYIRNQENMTPAEIVARGLIAAQKIIEERLDHSTQPLFILTYSH